MPTTIAARPPDRTRRRRVLGLTGLTAAAVLLTSMLATGDHPLSAPAPGLPPAPPPQAPPPAEDPPVGGWDVAAQTALASRPMPRLPESAAWPHPLHGGDTAAPIVLPMPTSRSGPVPSGFPGTVEGAIAQLAALTQVGVDGGDPHGYRQAYEAVAASGAPAVETTRLHRDLRRVRATVDGLPPTGPVPGLEFRWTPTSALIKGSTDGNRYTVVCVLGELVTGRHGQSVSTGAGDCQAFRWIGDEWRISPGARAADATLAWPGSPEAVRAGYRAVRW